MEQTKIKPLSKMQLANAYNVSLETLNSWLKPFKDKIGDYRGRMFTPKQVKIIFEELGEPGEL
jgi:hypothetical protein